MSVTTLVRAACGSRGARTGDVKHRLDRRTHGYKHERVSLLIKLVTTRARSLERFGTSQDTSDIERDTQMHTHVTEKKKTAKPFLFFEDDFSDIELKQL